MRSVGGLWLIQAVPVAGQGLLRSQAGSLAGMAGERGQPPRCRPSARPLLEGVAEARRDERSTVAAEAEAGAEPPPLARRLCTQDTPATMLASARSPAPIKARMRWWSSWSPACRHRPT